MEIKLNDKDIVKLINDNKLDKLDNLISFINLNKMRYSFAQLSKISELANSRRTHNAAYYTNEIVCRNLIKDLPNSKKFKKLDILEPSVGAGNFLPHLISKYKNVKEVRIDLVDIDGITLDVLKILISSLKIPPNFKIGFIKDDFLIHNFNKNYDIVIGNPPFKKILKEKDLLREYKSSVYNKDTNNLFSFFLEKSLKIGKTVALVAPKSLLSTPEFNKTRELLENRGIQKIADYGENAFEVKIETIGIVTLEKNQREFLSKKLNNPVKIESFITNKTQFKKSAYIFDNKYPYWLIYRNTNFDKIASKMVFDIFTAYRDRQITKKHTSSSGVYRVLKSRNLTKDGKIIDLKGYDSYVNNLSGLAISKFINNSHAVIVPNLSYYPRASVLPKNSLVDGSLAILIPKRKDLTITRSQLNYYSSKEFENFYKIARNYGTRSLNIDKNSVYFWGLKKQNE